MKKHLEKLHDHVARKYPQLKFAIGIGFVLVGLIAVVTPLTPGSWLVLVGLELVGVRVLTGSWLRTLFSRRSR